MCRIAAFPPHFPRDKALEILLDFEGANTDGVGSVYVRRNGEFIIDKHPTSLSKILKKGHPFLAHMPYNDGWTLAHLRAASHGCNAVRNTHPFLIGDWAFIHNGVWSEYNLVKMALKNVVKFEGETDTEVAGHLWNIAGPKKFAMELDYAGVFMGLHRNGQLQVAKTSGDLEVFHRTNKTILLASELPNKYRSKYEAERGWFHYSRKGKYMNHAYRPSPSYGLGSYVGGSYAPFSEISDEDIEEWDEEHGAEVEEASEGDGIPTYVPHRHYVPQTPLGFSMKDLHEMEDENWHPTKGAWHSHD